MCVRGVAVVGICCLGEKGEVVVHGELRFLRNFIHIRHQALHFRVYYILTITLA